MTNNKASADHLLTTSVPEVFSWSPDLIIYHDKCADGIVAAWACWKRWGDSSEYLASNYGHQPPADVAGRNILMVDFSFPEADLRAMVTAGAKSIVILDHHKTAQEALEPFAVASTAVGWYDHTDIDELLTAREWADDDAPNIIAFFDMDRSGARMAWDFATPFTFTPRLVELAERYDLWRFKPGTSDPAELLHLVIQTGEMSIRAMDYLDKELAGSDLAIRRGEAIYDWRAQLIKEIASRAHLRTVAGIEGVISVECPYSLVSAVGHHLLDLHPAAPFAAMSVTGEKAVTWSLRSHDDRLDVSEVAKGQGGGGHRNAAGFRVEIEPASDPCRLPAQAEASTLPGEVVAYLYRNEDGLAPVAEIVSFVRWTADHRVGWTETPLCEASPPTTPAVESGEGSAEARAEELAQRIERSAVRASEQDVERVAKAIARSFNEASGDAHWPNFIKEARAALAAINGETT